MHRAIAGGAVAALLLILPFPVYGGNPQIGILRHFSSVPAGLGAEGLATVGDGFFYVGTFSFTAPDGKILVYDNLGSIVKTITVPGLPQVGQVAFLDKHTLFAVAGNIGTGQGALVRVNRHTGDVAIVAVGFKLPNGLAIDKQGNMFVTDLLTGIVSKVTPSGSVSVFASGSLLAPAFLPQVGLSLGTNDLTFDKGGDALYVTDVGLSTVVRIQLTNDGGAGAITNFAHVPTPDGVAFDEEGRLYVTSPFTNSVWIVSGDGTAVQLALDTSHDSLNNPSNVAFVGRNLFITNLAIGSLAEVSVVTVSVPGLP